MGRADVSESIGSIAIGKYQLFATLGRGGMADVFLAVARGPMGFNKLTVIKRLRADHAEDPAFANMLLDEARLAARLSHPNVVHTYEVGDEAGAYFIAMEYLEGQPLVRIAKAMATGPDKLPPALCARIVADALAGLHYAHELRDYDGRPLEIVHRDVSPHNIFVTYDGIVKLMDFGIAKASSSASETEVGILKGKLAYMAPEQAKGEPFDRRADVFAMGVVLWELVTGVRLFGSAVAAATLHKLLSEPIPRLSDKIPGIDPRLDAVVAKSLEKDPVARYQTAQEMRTALEEYIAGSGTVMRQEDIARRVSDFFEETRQNAQKQIQIHMAQMSQATSTGQLVALNASALRGVRTEPTPSGKNLIRLSRAEGPRSEASGSTTSTAAPPASSGALPSEATPRRKRGGGLVAAASLCLVLAAAAFVSLRGRAPGVSPIPASGLATTVPVPPGPPLQSTSSASPAPPSASAPGDAVVAGAAPPAPHRESSLPKASAPSPVAPKPTPAVPPPAPSAAATADPVAAPAPANGYLTLDTYPWTRVSEDGRPLGVTPLVHVPLSAGTHVLTLENSEQGLKQQYPVTLKADESLSRRLGLK